MNDQISQLSIKALLREQVDYVIPMYQRNYAWGEAEITQLIQDVIDYLLKGRGAPQNYYIGTLVVFARQDAGKTVYETIDGQQRLTTLSLLASYLKNRGEPQLAWYDSLRIRFASREHSQKTFAAVFAGALEPDAKAFLAPQDRNEAIINGYAQIQKILPHKLRENGVELPDFTQYLLEHVVLMRVCVPPQTDLNHYFEVMNSRGEQLEKHEVLKARMMEALRDDVDAARSRHCLHLVWEACANMERYVQMGFTPAQRDAVFGQQDWGRFALTGFAALCDALALPANSGVASVALTLDELIEPTGGPGSALSAADEKPEEAPERFHAVINFPNFLLHVLRVMVDDNVPLDDKALMTAFDTHVFKTADPVATIKQFALTLLRCKYLFDHYVIKREFAKGTDGWSLKRLKWNAASDRRSAGRPSYVNTFGGDEETDGEAMREHRHVLMLLSAFHVSTPTRVYKYWLNAALKYLHDEHRVQEIQEVRYRRYLESVATAFVFDRYLAGHDKADYFEIIHKRRGQCQRRHDTIDLDAIAACLTYDHIENNLVFNYLDYLLWSRHQDDKALSRFEFTFRSSVEHYYPQKPMEGQPALDADVLDAFGNLCLISHSKNSRLSNFMPAAKKEYYSNSQIDSIKQHLMMQSAEWDADTIRAHGQHMIEVLVSSLERHAPVEVIAA